MIEYKLLKEIERDPSQTQRSLAEKLNVSLGKINYMITGLIEKGIIKAQRLTSEPRSIRWQYILTPDGIKEKMRLTRDYLSRRIVEFEALKQEIEELRGESVHPEGIADVSDIA
jgi:EPS-associated MarR family transcriptional regulator